MVHHPVRFDRRRRFQERWQRVLYLLGWAEQIEDDHAPFPSFRGTLKFVGILRAGAAAKMKERRSDLVRSWGTAEHLIVKALQKRAIIAANHVRKPYYFVRFRRRCGRRGVPSHPGCQPAPDLVGNFSHRSEFSHQADDSLPAVWVWRSPDPQIFHSTMRCGAGTRAGTRACRVGALPGGARIGGKRCSRGAPVLRCSRGATGGHPEFDILVCPLSKLGRKFV